LRTASQPRTCRPTSSTAQRSTTSARSRSEERSSRTATTSISTTRAATRSSRWRRDRTWTLAMRSSSRTATLLTRASTWRRSTSTWASCTTRRTLLTRRRAPWGRADSATEGWTRPTRRLSRSREGSCSARMYCCLRSGLTDVELVLVRVIVVTGAVVDLAAGMAALDLNRRVADGKLSAEAALEVAHDVLRLFETAIAHHHMAAQRDLLR